MINDFKDILKRFSEAPDGEVDTSMLPKFEALAAKDEIESDELLSLIDECVRYALASDFAIRAMDFVWKMMLLAEGKDMLTALDEAKPRRAKMEADELLERAKRSTA